MTKRNVMIYVDNDTFEQFKRKEGKGNISKRINEFMQQTILRSNEVIAPQDAALLEIEYNKIKEQFANTSARLQAIEEERQRIQQAIEEQTKADLVAEKERAENALKCKKCGNFVEEKTKVRLREGQLCKACFFSLTSEEGKQLGI